MPRLGIIALLVFLAIPILLMAADKPQPLVYNLAVNIEPEAGSIAVHGSVDIPLDNPAATTFKFNLHETLVIKKLTVNGKEAPFTFAPVDGLMPLPASRG